MNAMFTTVLVFTLVWLVMLAYQGLRRSDDAADRFLAWMATATAGTAAYGLMLGVILGAPDVNRPTAWLAIIMLVVNVSLAQAWLRAQ